MELNLMEATEKDGDPADLWVTLEAMGYSRMLELVEVRSHTCSRFIQSHAITQIVSFNDVT